MTAQTTPRKVKVWPLFQITAFLLPAICVLAAHRLVRTVRPQPF